MDVLRTIMDEIEHVVANVKKDEIDQVIGLIQKDRRIFVAGEGRSGFSAKGFAMRLMHLGYTVYVVGETITPAIKEGDILIEYPDPERASALWTLPEKRKRKCIGNCCDKQKRVAACGICGSDPCDSGDRKRRYRGEAWFHSAFEFPFLTRAFTLFWMRSACS